MTDKENTEALSNLIHACRLVGAKYVPDGLVFADCTKVDLIYKGDHWVVHHIFELLKTETVKQLMINLLTIHLKIIQEKA